MLDKVVTKHDVEMVYGWSALEYVGPKVLTPPSVDSKGTSLLTDFCTSLSNPLSWKSIGNDQICNRDGILIMEPSLTPYPWCSMLPKLRLTGNLRLSWASTPECHVWAPVYNPLHLQDLPLDFSSEICTVLTTFLGNHQNVIATYGSCTRNSSKLCGSLAAALVNPPPSSSTALSKWK